MRQSPAARLPAADLTGSGSDRVDSKASSSVSTPTLAAVSPNLTASFGERLGGDGRLSEEGLIELGSRCCSNCEEAVEQLLNKKRTPHAGRFHHLH